MSKVKRKAFRRTSYLRNPHCRKCKVPMILDGDPSSYNFCTVDHITPTSAGGKDVASNWRLLCRKCNMTKGGVDKPLCKICTGCGTKYEALCTECETCRKTLLRIAI